MQPVKIAIIGAGSAIFGLNALATLLREPALRGSTLALVDRNAEGLRLVHALAARMNADWRAGVESVSTTDRRAVLEGADFVACSIEVGPREDLWRTDWEITLRHGVRQPYAENGGPGGLFHAARNIPHILDIARDMERLCPRAPLLMLSNPLPRLCRAVAKYTTIRPIGLCHQYRYAYGLVGQLLADRLGLQVPEVLRDPDQAHDRANMRVRQAFRAQAATVLDIKSAGLNHFTWILDVRDRRTGEDLYPEVRARFLDAPPDYEPLTRDMLRLTGLLPATGDTHLCEYLPYTHNPITRPWERYGLHLYQWEYAARQRDTLWTEIERLAAPGGPSTERLREAESEGIFEVIHGLAGNANTYMEALNLPNGGTIAGLPGHAVVEAPAVLGGAGPLPLRIGSLPPIVAELCRREAERVELVVDAAVQGSREIALQALALDPTIDDLDLARAILDDYLATHRAHLPQFHGHWQL